jgi:hypothetical protein
MKHGWLHKDVSRPSLGACRNTALVRQSGDRNYVITNGVIDVAIDPQTFEEGE